MKIRIRKYWVGHSRQFFPANQFWISLVRGGLFFRGIEKNRCGPDEMLVEDRFPRHFFYRYIRTSCWRCCFLIGTSERVGVEFLTTTYQIRALFINILRADLSPQFPPCFENVPICAVLRQISFIPK